MTKSDLVAHFTKQGITRSTIYNTINLMVFFRFLCVKFINSNIFIHGCLNKRLLPFIHDFHQDLDYVFWPDLASAQYSFLCTKWMNENVNYVTKDTNPLSIPQALPNKYKTVIRNKPIFLFGSKNWYFVVVCVKKVNRYNFAEFEYVFESPRKLYPGYVSLNFYCHNYYIQKVYIIFFNSIFAIDLDPNFKAQA
ncbi:glucosylceramidase 4 [Brachionus plicatilis]|uniref:Glucosylceramidase 4 n=1 Tax=Brachionus plicatilis TaxID=10195 RepID=A0A3M7REC1_BRAPC|nr:glucosylceramidase 4 [Brachionus plicatilis]